MKQKILTKLLVEMDKSFWNGKQPTVDGNMQLVTMLYRLHRLSRLTANLQNAVKLTGGLYAQRECLSQMVRLGAVFVDITNSATAIDIGTTINMEKSHGILAKPFEKKYRKGRLKGQARPVREVIGSCLYHPRLPEGGAMSAYAEPRDFPKWDSLLAMASKPKYDFWIRSILVDRISHLHSQVKNDLVRASSRIENFS